MNTHIAMWVFFYLDTLNYIEKNVIIYNIK